MPTRQVAVSTLWQLGSQIAMAALSILTMKFVVTGLSKELVGHYNSAYGFLQIFGILADFGLYAVAVREVSETEDKERTLGGLIVLRSIITLLSLGAAVLIAWTIPDWRGTPLPMGITIAALVPFFTLLAGIMRAAFQVRYAMHFVFVAEVTQRLLTTSFIGLPIFFGIRGSSDVQIYQYMLAVGGAGAFVLFLLSHLYGRRLICPKLVWDGDLLKELLRKATPYGIAFLCIALYRQLDIALIALLRSDFDLQNAYYGSVQRMADMTYLLPTFLLNSVLPILGERERNGTAKAVLGKTLLLLLVIGSIAFAFALFWSRPLVSLLTNDAYLSTPSRPGSDTALLLISLPIFCNGLILYGFYVLLHHHRWQQLVVTLAVGAALSLTLNFSLIPRFGFVGASLTSIVVHVLLAIVLLPQSFAVAPITLKLRHLGQWFLFTTALCGSLFVTSPFLTSNFRTIVALGTATLWVGILLRSTGLEQNFRS